MLSGGWEFLALWPSWTFVQFSDFSLIMLSVLCRPWQPERVPLFLGGEYIRKTYKVFANQVLVRNIYYLPNSDKLKELRKKMIFSSGGPCAHKAENSNGFELLTCEFISFLVLK